RVEAAGTVFARALAIELGAPLTGI
ncbi:MAG: hypothetical protein QOG32_1666, partial [Chloroflexota bacterium]|nr:hypothetical protein [Chloroflexota bacterium]